jgi:hypothetical protein
MSIRSRLQRLEKRVQRLPMKGEPEDGLTEEEWLTRFEALGRQGCLAAEPDFPAALAGYREALHQAQAQAQPPFDPPADFMPHLADLPRLRLLNWRSPSRFPQVHAAWEWLAEMVRRVCTGIPPVTEVEFQALEAWFNAHVHRLERLAGSSQCLDLGDGRLTTAVNIRCGLSHGPRASGAGVLAEELRRLQARWGTGEP